MVLPTPQMLSSTSEGFDQAGSLNHSGPGMPTFSKEP